MAKHNDAGGGMTVKEAVITSVKVAALIGALYVLNYFLFNFLTDAFRIYSYGRFFVKTLHLYPNVGPEDLNIEMMEGMSRTILYLDIIAITIALYLKSRGKKPQN